MNTFIQYLNKSINLNSKIDLLTDETIFKIVDTLNVEKKSIKENRSMEELNRANEKVNILNDVRIVYLPPAIVASYQYKGEEPETYVNKVIDNFVINSGLCNIKPDLRHYGFNNPQPEYKDGSHGYEVLVTIPNDMEVQSPIVKKKFEGGLYAAHMIAFGDFQEWNLLSKWVESNDMYEANYSDNNFGCLEEHINYINHVYLPNTEPEGMQMDLLIPIREKLK